MDFVSGLIAFVVGVIIPLLFAKFTPNEKFESWGFAIGKKLSKKGNQFLGDGYEDGIENNITGSFVAFANGLQRGADSDD